MRSNEMSRLSSTFTRLTDEILYQQQMDRTARTAPFQSQIAIAYDPVQQSVAVTLPPEHVAQLASGNLQLYRPSSARLDRKFPFPAHPLSALRFDTPGLSAGVWKARLNWKVGADEFYFEQILRINPVSATPPAPNVRAGL